jgi:hypothetical protein
MPWPQKGSRYPSEYSRQYHGRNPRRDIPPDTILTNSTLPHDTPGVYCRHASLVAASASYRGGLFGHCGDSNAIVITLITVPPGLEFYIPVSEANRITPDKVAVVTLLKLLQARNRIFAEFLPAWMSRSGGEQGSVQASH